MNDSESRAALGSLSGPLPVADVEALEAQHHRIRPQLRAFVRGLPVRRRRQRWVRGAALAGGLTLSASLGLAVWLGHVSDSPPFAVEQGQVSELSSGRGFVTAAKETVALRTPQGVRVVVTGESRVEAVTANERHEQLRLVRGSVRVEVPRRAAGSTFSVRTPDATVTVHGTVFSVTVSGAGAQAQTCVRVTEGVVSVEQAGAKALVKAGQDFNCPVGERPAQARVATATEDSVVPPPRGTAQPITPGETQAVARQEARPAAPGASADATLGQQNRLLAEALQAERASRYDEARSRLRELIERYPSSTLLPDAKRSLERVERKLR